MYPTILDLARDFWLLSRSLLAASSNVARPGDDPEGVMTGFVLACPGHPRRSAHWTPIGERDLAKSVAFALRYRGRQRVQQPTNTWFELLPSRSSSTWHGRVSSS
jgi:hypothetical protein